MENNIIIEIKILSVKFKKTVDLVEINRLETF